MISLLVKHHALVLSVGPGLLLLLVILVLLIRRAQHGVYAVSHRELLRARESGSHAARLQHPEIDLNQCIGCGACVRACPEQGVLGLLHGQAVVVHGSRCVGHGLCAAACPTGAISLTFGDLSSRRDLPALTPELEATGVEGLFLAGELGGFALVRTAVAQGVAVADAVAARAGIARSKPARVAVAVGGSFGAEDETERVVDLLVVGAGPGGLACSLRAKEIGVNFLVIEQASRIGGTVAAYPRRKMVMTQPVQLPLHGNLPKLTYTKEELIELWERVTERSELPLRLGVRLDDLTRSEDGIFTAITSDGPIRARNVCLALGRRGSPRKLGIPGEDLPKVSYSLLDAESYRGRHILVVGGGDSAVEAALGLADQPGNRVTISYRKGAFFRLKARNDARITRAIHEGRIAAVFSSEVLAISDERVRLTLENGEQQALQNDDVFIFAGGEPPFALLERAGVSFDPADRPVAPEDAERGSGLLSAVGLTFACAVAVMAWAIRFHDYYGLEASTRPNSALHNLLRPGGPIGLPAGLLACLLFVFNLTYIIRRSSRWGRRFPGTLRTWMGWHVFTGLTASLCVFLHAGFTMRPTAGGHALLALGVVTISGIVGRYIYAIVPRAANGTESSLENLRSQLASISSEWDRDGRGFGTRVREQVDRLITETRWHPSLPARIGMLAMSHRRLRTALRQLHQQARDEGMDDAEVGHVLLLARRAFRLTLLVTHYQEIIAFLSSWRYFHRWLALLMVLLVIVHIIAAARYAPLDWNFLWILCGGKR